MTTRSGWVPRSVWLVGWISLLTDTATEAIYPLLPLFLTVTLGASPFALGLIEGVAEATASVAKIVVGRVSDRQRRRRPWVIGGYALSSLARPAMALVGAWGHVLALRFVDRIGKGVRGAPRDALMAEWAPAEARGRIFSFQRAMDHAGAVTGPLLAAAFLWTWPGAYRALFASTIVPGLAVVALTFLLPRDRAGRPEGGGEESPPGRPAGSQPLLRGSGGPLPQPLKRLLAVIGLFTLANSTDAYLLLRLGQILQNPVLVPFAWAALHGVKVASSFLGGSLADRVGRRATIGAGWLVYAAVYATFGLASDPVTLGAAFLVYGAYFGLTEGAEKAWIADWTPAALRGTAFGVYNGVLGFGALAASLLFGALWNTWGPTPAFLTGAAVALVAVPLLWVVAPGESIPPGARRP